jgi:hypothetical protein
VQTVTSELARATSSQVHPESKVKYVRKYETELYSFFLWNGTRKNSRTFTEKKISMLGWKISKIDEIAVLTKKVYTKNARTCIFIVILNTFQYESHYSKQSKLKLSENTQVFISDDLCTAPRSHSFYHSSPGARACSIVRVEIFKDKWSNLREEHQGRPTPPPGHPQILSVLMAYPDNSSSQPYIR